MRVVVGIALVLAAACLAYVFLHNGLNPETVKHARHASLARKAAHPLVFAAALFCAYVLVAIAIMPGAEIMTMAVWHVAVRPPRTTGVRHIAVGRSAKLTDCNGAGSSLTISLTASGLAARPCAIGAIRAPHARHPPHTHALLRGVGGLRPWSAGRWSANHRAV